VIAVIFEVVPKPGHKQEYLDLATKLRNDLEKIDGFISIERFESLTHPGKILSLSFWKNEDSVKAWRNVAAHRTAQERGRCDVFTDYRLRVARVIRDYGMNERDQAPADSRSKFCEA